MTSQPNDKMKAFAVFPNQRALRWMANSACYWNGEFYEPPIPRYELARSLDVMPHHDSALEIKHNLLMSTMQVTEPSILSDETVERLAWDYLIYGDYFLNAHTNRLGGLHHYEHLPSLHTRKSRGKFVMLEDGQVKYKYPDKNVLYTMRYDGRQEMYGHPPYLAALLSIYLGQAASKFRYHYVKNRSNTGFLLYLAGDIDDDVIESIEDALAGGNDEQFGNVVIHDPTANAGANTSKKIDLIPISDKGNKDDYPDINQTTLESVLAAHRVPPQLMGIVPKNNGGFGSVREATEVFYLNEIRPLHRKIRRINQHAGRDLIEFLPYSLEAQ